MAQTALHAGFSWVIRLLCGAEIDSTLHRVRHWERLRHGPCVSGNEGEPLKDRFCTLLIVLHQLVCDAIGDHDLRSTQLILGEVDLINGHFTMPFFLPA